MLPLKRTNTENVAEVHFLKSFNYFTSERNFHEVPSLYGNTILVGIFYHLTVILKILLSFSFLGRNIQQRELSSQAPLSHPTGSTL